MIFFEICKGFWGKYARIFQIMQIWAFPEKSTDRVIGLSKERKGDRRRKTRAQRARTQDRRAQGAKGGNGIALKLPTIYSGIASRTMDIDTDKDRDKDTDKDKLLIVP